MGRPWLVFGIERKSGMPHGYFLSWEPPNYRSVMEGLLFGILPKHALNARFPSLRGAWECEGLPRAIAIDNGPEFANRHLDDAARQVDFDVLPCPVRVPWFKSTVKALRSKPVASRACQDVSPMTGPSSSTPYRVRLLTSRSEST